MSARVALLTSTAAAVLALAAPALATPVKCTPTDVTPGDRVFAEPELSVGFMRFDEFECGIKLLEQEFPGKIAVTTFGTSEGGHPLYDIQLTNESVTTPKRRLLVINSIHGNEMGGREGGARVIEDMVDGRFEGNSEWVKKTLEQFVVHFIFPNPDGWVAGDVTGSPGASVEMTRGNAAGVDLNREEQVKGWVDVPKNVTPEGRAMKNLLTSGDQDWYLGTDNHGQSADTYAADGLQIVGQFDYQKSETLARFAEGIEQTMKDYDFGKVLGALRDQTGQDLGTYHWGTLYDMLGYSASGSVIDYYNTPELVHGTGFATELTVGQQYNWPEYSGVLNHVWVNAIRAVNYTMFKQAIDPQQFTYHVDGHAAYVFDPKVIASDDDNGAGFKAAGVSQVPYHVTRMKFLEDLDKYADHPLDAIAPGDVATADLGQYDSLVLANGPLPDDDSFYAALKAFVEGGGNLIVTDQALKALPKLGVLTADKIASSIGYVGFVDFSNRTDALNQNLRGVASQTYDTVPIGYRFGTPNSAPNWTVDQTAWEAAGGRTAGTNGSGRTAYGEIARGQGRIRILGALLPDPTEAFDHRYGLQSYAVTYTGYTLLQNMLAWHRPAV